MDKKTLNYFRKLLEDEREKLLSRLKRSMIDTISTAPDSGRDEYDEASDEVNLSTSLRLADREKQLLSLINEALERISSGEYGFCDECGEPIAPARLKVRPMATLCIHCKEVAERRKKQFASGEEEFLAPITWTDDPVETLPQEE